ncbi:MAG: hypothetical protein PWP23_221 [Candidatus Sumerlaeota bacterium]|nr:hypothetical protein [Candidatus Sumerlaeota bacterium]
MSINDELTIVIPAKNEARNLPLLFEDLLAQDYPAIRQTTIIVADAASTDETPEIIAQYAALLPLRMIPGGLPGIGRNAGARLARSKYLLFLDADIRLAHPGIIRVAIGEARIRRRHLVTALLGRLGGSPLDGLYYAFCNLVVRASRLTGPFSPGAFMLWERRAFLRLGGFDEKAHFAEDYQLSRKVPGRRFGIVKGPVLADNERFTKFGYGRVALLFFETMCFGHTKAYFRRNRNYWG